MLLQQKLSERIQISKVVNINYWTVKRVIVKQKNVNRYSEKVFACFFHVVISYLQNLTIEFVSIMYVFFKYMVLGKETKVLN